MQPTKNPFIYTRPVEGKIFCNREKEQEDLLYFIKNTQNVLLYSHRKYGKTSLINQVFRNIQTKKLNIGKIIIDLYGTLTEKDFITSVFENLVQIESKTDKLINLTSKFLKSLRLKFTYDPITQNPSISGEFEAIDPKPLLNGVMKILEDYSKKNKLVVVFDEFQEISRYSESEEFEKRLRAIIQRQKNICYIFAGSQSHILTQMFNSKSRAFYNQAQSYPLKKISVQDYIEWTQDIFNEQSVAISKEIIEDIVYRCENQPAYIQQFLYFLWRQSSSDLNNELIDIIENEIIESRRNEYINVWETLTQNQKKTLKLIILKNGKELFEASALVSVGLKNPSMVSKALKSLTDKEIISKNDKYQIQDAFLRKWMLFRLK